MKNEKPQINYTNFDFFNIDSLVPEEVPTGMDAYSNLLNEDNNYVEEDNPEQITENENISLSIPESTVTNNSFFDNEETKLEENINLDIEIETPLETSNELLPGIETVEAQQISTDDLLPTEEATESQQISTDDLLPTEESEQPQQISTDDLLPTEESEQPQQISTDDLLPTEESEQPQQISTDDLLPLEAEINQSEIIKTSDLLIDLDAQDTSKPTALQDFDLNISVEPDTSKISLENLDIEDTSKVTSLQDFDLNISASENKISIDDLIPQDPVMQDNETRIDDLIDDSNEIIYNKKTAVDRKIESLEQNLSKFETALNPQKDPIVARTMSMLKNKDTPVNINPGYADDLMTFFKKINDPPKWRVMMS
jgi:hypothetical protein